MDLLPEVHCLGLQCILANRKPWWDPRGWNKGEVKVFTPGLSLRLLVFLHQTPPLLSRQPPPHALLPGSDISVPLSLWGWGGIILYFIIRKICIFVLCSNPGT